MTTSRQEGAASITGARPGPSSLGRQQQPPKGHASDVCFHRVQGARAMPRPQGEGGGRGGARVHATPCPQHRQHAGQTKHRGLGAGHHMAGHRGSVPRTVTPRRGPPNAVVHALLGRGGGARACLRGWRAHGDRVRWLCSLGRCSFCTVNSPPLLPPPPPRPAWWEASPTSYTP